MDKTTRNLIQKATQDARRLVEKEYADQLGGTFDILLDGTILAEPGPHLDDREKIVREKIAEAIDHESAKGVSAAESVGTYLREAAFTTLNRFVALKMLEARGLVQECISKGEHSSGFKEFTGLAPGLASLPDHGYRLYIESLFDEIGREVGILFDRRDPASLLWLRRQALADLFAVLNSPELVSVWGEDESIGWVYQYFNTGADREKARYDKLGKPKAPQNSYELAVRNQFFTPRYVVEFLTDNTLGRIWYEMCQGRSFLIEKCRYLVRQPNEIFLTPGEKTPTAEENETDLSQEELLKKPVYIEHRPKKDPRDIRVLDPACGSGHFLLYAFDLLETIYIEAWEDGPSLESEVTNNRLRSDFPDVAELRREIPRLILEHNLHGIDIDPRAVQIAALSLWMRAQRSWREMGLKPSERPLVVRTNVVCAEPMPGQDDMRREFTASLKPRVLGQILDEVFEKMKLAGEVGSLLKIEEEIKGALAEAKKHWGKQPKPVQLEIFGGLAPEKPSQMEPRFDVKGITDERFWERAEDRILDSLKDYAQQAENGRAVAVCRSLFAEDAIRGFAFIDVCLKRYDAVLMNPPFGESPAAAGAFIAANWPDEKGDLGCCFVSNGLRVMVSGGRLGVLMTRTPYFLSSFTQWRKNVVLDTGGLAVFVDLGLGVLDAMVETCACIYAPGSARVQHARP